MVGELPGVLGTFSGVLGELIAAVSPPEEAPPPPPPPLQELKYELIPKIIGRIFLNFILASAM